MTSFSSILPMIDKTDAEKREADINPAIAELLASQRAILRDINMRLDYLIEMFRDQFGPFRPN